MESNALRTFALLFKYEQAWLLLIQEVVIIANVKALSHQKV